MLNFRTANIFFIISILFVCALHYTVTLSWWWLLPCILAYILCLVLGSARINSNFYATVQCNGITRANEVAITFDDGPTPFTQKILQTLSEYGAPATFFVIGKNIDGNEELLKQTITAGHTIGNHTFSHSFFIDLKNAEGFKAELQQTADRIYRHTGINTKFFRPPYGVTTPHLVRAAKELDHQIIGWNIRSLDTTGDDEKKILDRVKKQLKPGAIILFHDTSEKTNNVLQQLLLFLQQNNFKVVKLEQLLNTENQ